MKNYIQIIVGIALVSIAVFSRVVLHLPNFAAMAAVGLFAGFYFRGKVAFLVPLLAVFISDFFIGFYDFGSMLFVYAAWMVPVFIGKSTFTLGKVSSVLSKILTVGSKAVLASVAFYLISNLGVWIFGGMYAPSLAGLIECYVLAVPFFRMALIGDLIFSGVLFGAFYAVEALTSNKKIVAPAYLKK